MPSLAALKRRTKPKTINTNEISVNVAKEINPKNSFILFLSFQALEIVSCLNCPIFNEFSTLSVKAKMFLQWDVV